MERQQEERLVTERDRKEAAETLAAAQRRQAASFRRGIYSRRFAITMAIWSGVLMLGAVGHRPWFVLWLLAGFIGFYLYRGRRGIWPQEIHTSKDLWITLTCVFVLLSVVGAGFWVASLGLSWAPSLTGLLVGLLIYGICELSYHNVWATGDGNVQ